jgi:membrane-bound metal-dependent hydrolase YbcI (DUF457 family)
MMGSTHAMTGTLAFGGASLAFTFGLVPGTVTLDLPDWLILGVLTTAGALFPDIDHHKATVTRSFGGLTRIVRWILIKPFFGKHREGTHSIFFAALVGFGAWLMIENLHYLGCKIGLLVLLSIVTSSLIRLFKIKGWLDDIMPIPVWGFVIFFTDVNLKIVPWALALGCLTHVIGDCLTDRGCPILWPISKDKITLALFSTGKAGEAVAQIVIIISWLLVTGLHAARWAGLV